MGIQEPALDFVVTGYQDDTTGMVILFASKNITSTYLSEEQPLRRNRQLNQWDLDGPLHIELTAVMKNYVMVSASTYPEAWQALFDIWSAEKEHEKALPATPLDKYSEISGAGQPAINYMNCGGQNDSTYGPE